MGHNKKGAVYSKEEKICVYCGNSFKGTFGAYTCSHSCRFKMNRLIDFGLTPKFYLQALNNGQKVPPLLDEKRGKKKNISVQNLTEPLKDTHQVKKLSMDKLGTIKNPGNKSYFELRQEKAGLK